MKFLPPIPQQLDFLHQHIWIGTFKLHIPAHEENLWMAQLSGEEQKRAHTFRTEQARHQFVMCRTKIRHVLSHFLGIPPKKLPFSTEGQGKPVLLLAPHLPALHFNLSHAHDYGLLGVTALGPIGVDVEYKRAMPHLEALAQHFFSFEEFSYLKGLHESEQEEAFFTLWTAKEAYLKANGKGIGEELSTTLIRQANPPSDKLYVFLKNEPEKSSFWFLRRLVMPDGYVGACAIYSHHPVSIFQCKID